MQQFWDALMLFRLAGLADYNANYFLKILYQNAIGTLRSNKKLSAESIAKFISQQRNEDEATPLHIASQFGHKDVIRALLVSPGLCKVSQFFLLFHNFHNTN
jgi:ankyrin repeat protein